MEDYKYWPHVQVFSRKPGQLVTIDCAYDAARFLLSDWPVDIDDSPTEKLTDVKRILIKCLEGDCSPRVARVAFVEAAREAGIFMPDEPRPAAPPAGEHSPRWRFAKRPRRSRTTA